MKQRVRAILITPDNTTLMIKRIRPGIAPYWVIVGGGIEDSDTSQEAALLREIREEIAGDAEIVRLLHEIKNPKGRRSTSTSHASRHGTSTTRAAQSSSETTAASTSLRRSPSPPRPSRR
ncbi:NUDIX domain-containing protein [Streptomyces sanglieri]|uniref:NUDIX domain-containing protein n=1 Tax=Streptomyces sanglieri TaxID=193460 RepID=A0ABW2WPY8_9ACTN